MIMKYKGAIELGLVQAESISAFNSLIFKMFVMATRLRVNEWVKSLFHITMAYCPGWRIRENNWMHPDLQFNVQEPRFQELS